MSFNLGELAISLNLHTAVFDRDLDLREKRLERFGRRRISVLMELEDNATKSLAEFENNIVSTQRWLNRNRLTVRAGHEELTELNRHIEAKRTHVKEVQQWLDKNPLTARSVNPKLDSNRLVPESSKTERVLANNNFQQRKIEQKIEYSVKVSLNDSMEISSTQLNRIADEIKKLSANSLEVVKEQRNVSQAIKQESAVSIGNFLKGRAVSGFFNATQKSLVKTFNLDTAGLEKALDKILPSSKMLGQDINTVVKKFDKLTESSERFNKMLDQLAINLADSTNNASSLKEVFSRFIPSINAPVAEFVQGTAKRRDEILNNPQEFISQAGLEKEQLPETLVQSTVIKSVIRNLVKTLAPNVQNRKNKIQDERLGNVLNRAIELTNVDIKKVRKDTGASRVGKNVLKAVDDELEELILVISGHTDNAKVGLARASEINKQLQDQQQLGKKVAVGIDNPDTMIGKGHSAAKETMSVARPNIRGFSKDAEEMAAQAIAALTRNPNLKVKLVGESGGGLAVEEAIQILNKLGYGDRVAGAGFGTPDMVGKASKSSNFKAYLGINEEEALGDYVQKLVAPIGLIEPRALGRRATVAQSMKGLEGHTIDNYYGTDEFTQFVYGIPGITQQNIKPKEIKAIRDQIIKDLLNDNFDSEGNGFVDAKERKRIVGESTAPFAQLETDIEALQTDLATGLIEEAREAVDNIIFTPDSNDFNQKMEEGDIDFFKSLSRDVMKAKLLLKQLDLSASKMTKVVIQNLSDTLNDFSQTIPQYQNADLLKTKGFLSNSDNLLAPTSEGISTPEELAEDLDNIQPQIEKELAKVRGMANSPEQREFKKKLEKQIKTIKLLRIYLAKSLDFDYEELINNPSQYLRNLKGIPKEPKSIIPSDPWSDSTDSPSNLKQEQPKEEPRIEAKTTRGRKAQRWQIVGKSQQQQEVNPFDIPEKKPKVKQENTLKLILKTNRQILSAVERTSKNLQGCCPGHKDKSALIDGELIGDDRGKLSKPENKALNSASSIGRTMLEGTMDVLKFGYGVSKVIESTTVGMLPGFDVAKRGLQVGVPMLGGVAIASQVPGLMPAIGQASGLAAQGSQTLLSPLINGGGVMLGDAVSSGLSTLPFGMGQAIGGGVSTMAIEAGNAIAGLLPAVVATGTAIKATNKAIEGSKQKILLLTGSSTKAVTAGENITRNLLTAAKSVTTFREALDSQQKYLKQIQGELISSKELKKLPSAERIEYGKQLALSAAQGKVNANTLKEEIPKSERTGTSKEALAVRNLLSQFSSQMKRAKKILAREKINIDDVVDIKNITSQV